MKEKIEKLKLSTNIKQKINIKKQDRENKRIVPRQ